MPVFCISSPVFQGFRMIMKKDEIESMDHVKNTIRIRLRVEMDRLGLEYLVKQANELRLCHHGYEITDVLEANDESLWYVCDSSYCNID